MIIKTPSRIHITLIDLNASIGRVDGGIGLALDKPNIEISAEEHEDIIVGGPLKDRAEGVAKRVLDSLKIKSGIKIKIKRAYPQHVGLGSGTQISLAVGKAICEIYDFRLGVREIAKLVGRGGTSGIGIAAFEHGGFILDGGHSTKEKKGFLPSSASRASPAPVLARYAFPDWKILLVIPKIRREVYGIDEINIFKKSCPIDIGEVERLSHVILMKTLPSIIERDIETFGESINDIQGVGFKKLELKLQPEIVREIMEVCRNHSYGAGLSSFGPTIYCLVKNENEIFKALKGRRDEVENIIVTKADNNGTLIRR